MPSFTPLRKTYSTLSSSSLSSDDIRRPKENVVETNKSSPRTIPRHSFLIRVIIFTLLEFSFIALVSAALRGPIILDLSFTDTEVKGTVTAIAIFWHALAVYVVKDVLLNVFSAEWIKQNDGSQNLTLQELDIVSRLTTGFIDQVKHCVSRRATQPFRLSFLSFLLLMVLNGLGPSAIGVDHAPYDYSTTIQVGNITADVPVDAITFAGVRRASAAVQLEVVQNFTTLGFRSRQPNILIPWPSSDPMSENMTMRYQSDVIRYNYNCSWEIPSMLSSSSWLVGGDNISWIIYSLQFNGISSPSVAPLLNFADTKDFNITRSFAPFLFVGGGASSRLNLEGLPSLVIPPNTTGTLDGQFLNKEPLLVSALLCDPQLEILPATINATTSFLEATILPGSPTVKNIPAEAAEILFSTSLLEATSDMSYAQPISVTSQQLFLTTFTDFNSPQKPLSLDQINHNMNNALASSAKAYLSGYKLDIGADNLTFSSFGTVNTSAVMEVQKMALVGSKPFFVASSVTIGLLVILLGALVAITRPDQLEGFELENIVGKLL